MIREWNKEERRRYEAITDDGVRLGCQWLILLAASLFPAFSFLDYATQGHLYSELSTVRFVTTLLYGLAYLLMKAGATGHRPFTLALVLLGMAAVSITWMCVILGGFSSPYYAGVNLVVLAAILVLPIGGRKMAAIVSCVIAIYLLGIFNSEGFRLREPEALLNNLYFILATGIIGITAAYLTEKLRREAFDNYLRLELAQADLKRSKDLLQLDLKSEQGNVETLVVEITERKTQLERALEAAQAARAEAQRALELREEFISLASHELNTPLTSLKMQTQMAQRKIKGELGLTAEGVEKVIDTYDAQLKRLIRIVGDMLDISRIKSGKLELERAQIDLRQLIAEVIERTAGELDSQGKAEIEFPGGQEVWGFWDPFRIEQVILNLLTNGLKYGKGKPVTVKLREQHREAIVEVTDQGIGIPGDSVERIFQRFERAVQSREYGGLGLGLYISRQIIEAHGGSLSVQSQVGQGSTFSFHLPQKP